MSPRINHSEKHILPPSSLNHHITQEVLVPQTRHSIVQMTSRVQQLLDQHKVLVFPGVYDTLSAKIAERCGCPLAFVSGYSVAATTIGEPDLGLLTQMEMIERARHICGCVDLPIIVDADTGYGNPLNVMRTVKELIAAGAAGCFLEDQQWPKKCGHMRGKKVVDREEYLQKICAAVAARADQDFFIVARTDALAAVGLDEAIDRVEAAREAGADASFVEAPGSIEHMAQVGRRAPKPIVANMIEGGRTPLLVKSELAAMGFALILHPLAGLFAAASALQRVYQKIQVEQTTLGHKDSLMLFDEFNDLIGVENRYAEAERFGA